MPGFAPVGSLPVASTPATAAVISYVQADPWQPYWRIQTTLRPATSQHRAMVLRRVVLHGVRRRGTVPLTTAVVVVAPIPSDQLKRARQRYVATFHKWHKSPRPHVRGDTIGAPISTAPMRFAQLAREVVHDVTASARFAQLAREVVRDVTASVRFAQLVREVVRPSLSADDDVQVHILW
jgi:hypothetical protein